MTMIFERSPDTEAVASVLAGVNDEISYADLARRAGLSIKRTKQVLASARRGLFKKEMLFGVIRGVGLKRLDARGTLKDSEDTKKKLYRGTRRGIKKMDTAANHQHELSPSEQVQFTTTRTVLHFVGQSLLAKHEPPPKPKVEPPEMPTAENLLRMKK